LEVAKILPFLLLCAFLLLGYLLSKKQTKIDALEEQLSESDQKFNDLKEVVDTTTTSLETLRIRYEERVTSSRVLEGEIRKLRSQIQTFEKLTAKLKDSSEILELDLAKSVDENVKKQSGKITVYELFSLLKKQKMDVIHTNSARKQMDEEVKALKEEVREKAHELEVLSIKSDKLKTTLNKYKREKNAFSALPAREAALSRRKKISKGSCKRR
jgi:chromosome segregation ATPase